MATMSAKNMGLSLSGQQLGLGDMVTQQLADQEAERKKKLGQLAQAQAGTVSPSAAALGLGGGY